jgi:hypothetical protein
MNLRRSKPPRYSIRLLSAVVAVVLVLAASAGLAGASAGVPSTTPAANNVLVNQDNSVITAHNSPSLAQNPAKPNQLVVVDRVDRQDYNATIHISNDDGKTWQDSTLVLPAGSMSKLFAATAVFDKQGILYVQFVTLSGPGNSPDSVWIERSTDGGISFDQPSHITGANAFQTSLAVDRKTGRLFSVWLQSNATATHCNLCFAQTGLPIVLSYSDDQGRSWSQPAQVSDTGRAMIGAPALAIDSHGNPDVLYYDYGSDTLDWNDLPGTYGGKFTLVLARSTDRGATFSPGVVVDADIVPPGRFLVYLPTSPGFAIGTDGRLVATWADARYGEADILARTSTDGGTQWSAPVKVNRDANGDGVNKSHPAVSVAPSGRIDILYYDDILDHRGTTADVFMSSSTNGGASFPTLKRVSSESSALAVGPQGTPFDNNADFGTRIAVLSQAHQTIAVWTDTRSGSPDTGRQDIYSGVVGFPTSGLTSLQKLVVAIGILLGIIGVGLFLLSRRRQSPEATSAAPPPTIDTPPPLPPLVPSPGQV